MTPHPLYRNIPSCLQELPKWVVARGSDKVPLNPRTLEYASVSDPNTWGTFLDAVDTADKHGLLIGFVFDGTGWTGVDLDYSEEPEVAFFQSELVSRFRTYQELSFSGKGTHIICRGKIPQGARRGRVEMYSTGRFFIFTGIVSVREDVNDCQESLDWLYDQLRSEYRSTGLQELAPVNSDDGVVVMATNAVNGHKFASLYRGELNGYPSQSEADYALLSMLAFYSPSNEQVRRLFRDSPLGQRAKATRNDTYLDRALQKLRGKEPEALDFTELLAKYTATPPPLPVLAPPLPLPLWSFDARETLPLSLPPPLPVCPLFPPGLVGAIAAYILAAARKPVAEVALSAALALVAGIAGRQYNVSGLGLNLYIITLGNTGVGKDGGPSGIDALVTAIHETCPQIAEFMGPGEFASGQGLVRILAKKPCFLSVISEMGLTLQRLCSPNVASHEKQLTKVLLDVFAKSGKGRFLHGTAYADPDREVPSVQSPCVTILGDSTPSEFFEALDLRHVSQGLIPRLLCIRYDGIRNPTNENPCAIPKIVLTELTRLLHTVLSMKMNHRVEDIKLTLEAAQVMRNYDRLGDEKVNSNDNDSVRDLWSRAYVKALKVAGVVAVGADPHAPLITADIARWSIGLVTKDVEDMMSLFVKGEVGSGDHRQESDIRAAVDKYVYLDEAGRFRYRLPLGVTKFRDWVPLSFLQRVLLQKSAFEKDRRGAKRALQDNVDSMCRAGMLVRIPAREVEAMGGGASEVYRKGGSW